MTAATSFLFLRIEWWHFRHDIASKHVPATGNIPRLPSGCAVEFAGALLDGLAACLEPLAVVAVVVQFVVVRLASTPYCGPGGWNTARQTLACSSFGPTCRTKHFRPGKLRLLRLAHYGFLGSREQAVLFLHKAA